MDPSYSVYARFAFWLGNSGRVGYYPNFAITDSAQFTFQDHLVK